MERLTAPEPAAGGVIERGEVPLGGNWSVPEDGDGTALVRGLAERSTNWSGVPHFCGDLPEAEQKLVLATGAVPVADLFNQQVPGTTWRTKPSWYIVANNDRTVHPDLERSAAERMGAKIRPVDSSHVPMLSHPDFVLDVIREAAESLDVQAKPTTTGRSSTRKEAAPDRPGRLLATTSRFQTQ
ncbi:alpha/beta hydrolase [Streptomyces sp. CG1]|uniref:alpha/beta hydrolase n=1 Tax=Streptomyces sp. CG1 TaxID=1287523 RepID=UPI0034E2A099